MPSISIKVIYQFQSRSVKSFPYIPYIPQYRGTHKAVHAARPVVRQPEAQLSGCVRQPERKSLPAGPHFAHCQSRPLHGVTVLPSHL
jgi:hypothetical protein